MTSEELLRHRLINQKLVGPLSGSPATAVAWLGAVQAQEYAMAKWAIGLRTNDATSDTVEAAVNDGAILRTHVLRPTWHFVTPADLRWMLTLTAPHVRAAMQYMDRKLEIDRRFLNRCHRRVLLELRGGRASTRTELASILAKEKIPVQGPRLAHVFIHAELDGLICSGPRRAGKSTYMLIDNRVPSAKPLSLDYALAELARRYFTSRGPATVQDFSWWSGLAVREASLGVDALNTGFERVTCDGRIYVLSTTPTPPKNVLQQANFFLPDYDEYGIAYKDRTALFASRAGRKPEVSLQELVAFNRMIIIDGTMVGSWRREEKSDHIELEQSFFTPLSSIQKRRLTRAVDQYAKFVGKPVQLTA